MSVRSSHFRFPQALAYFELAVTFWIPGILFTTQLNIEAACWFWAVRNEPAGGEKIMDLFPNGVVDHRVPVDEERSISVMEDEGSASKEV